LQDGKYQTEIVSNVLKDNKFTRYHEKINVIEIGTGRGGFLAQVQKKAIFPNAKFEGVDMDLASLLINYKLNESLLNSNYHLTCAYGGNLPFEDHQFDLLVSFSTLEHVGDKGKKFDFLKECTRCLERNGVGILVFPNRFNIFSPEEHTKIRLFGFLPPKIKNGVSYQLAGMPSDDLYPPSYFELKTMLSNIQDINYRILTYQHYHNNRTIRSLSRTLLYKILGSGFILVLSRI